MCFFTLKSKLEFEKTVTIRTKYFFVFFNAFFAFNREIDQNTTKSCWLIYSGFYRMYPIIKQLNKRISARVWMCIKTQLYSLGYMEMHTLDSFQKDERMFTNSIETVFMSSMRIECFIIESSSISIHAMRLFH